MRAHVCACPPVAAHLTLTPLPPVPPPSLPSSFLPGLDQYTTLKPRPRRIVALWSRYTPPASALRMAPRGRLKGQAQQPRRSHKEKYGAGTTPLLVFFLFFFRSEKSFPLLNHNALITLSIWLAAKETKS